MTRYDMDIHAMEPESLWPAGWSKKWPDKGTLPMSDYLRQLDATGCDVGVFLPTRALFMDDFSGGIYQEWADEFCYASGGRLLAAEWYDGKRPPRTGGAPHVVTPRNLMGLLGEGVSEPIIVHSCVGLRYSANFHVDHALTHPLDAMQVVAALAAYEWKRPNVAILECDTWWADGFVRRLESENLSRPLGVWLGGSVGEWNDPPMRSAGFGMLLGSDFPHYDAADLSLVDLPDRERAWKQAEAFLGGN